MGKPVKVFWYCEKWQPGGIQRVQVNLLPYFNSEEIRFDLAFSEDDTALFDEKIAAAGARKLVTLSKRYGNPGKRTLENFFAMQKVIRDGHYDAVHFNACHGVELMYLLWAWMYRVPVRIVHARNNGIGAGGKSRPAKIAAHNICKHLLGRMATVRLANSDLSAQWLFSKADIRKGRVRVLKNGVDAKGFAFDPAARDEARKALNLESAFTVGHVGHFSWQKNHKFLLEVFAEIARREPNARLLLVGEGEEEAAVREQARTLGILDRVIFYGATENVPPLMQAMDTFVFPSRFEGCGNALLEAQAAGMPCFASQGVIPEAVAVTPLLHWLPLSERPAVWAEAVVSRTSGVPRQAHAEEVIRAGYGLAAMTESLRNIYLGEG
ncbi:MAG: glycosyltransferase [Clostridia bacterium]|nr:glycosyltransferase [Clostridia bacterium]